MGRQYMREKTRVREGGSNTGVGKQWYSLILLSRDWHRDRRRQCRTCMRKRSWREVVQGASKVRWTSNNHANKVRTGWEYLMKAAEGLEIKEWPIAKTESIAEEWNDNWETYILRQIKCNEGLDMDRNYASELSKKRAEIHWYANYH